MGRKRVVFCHGLESGPSGRKARYLRRHFPSTIVPDLEMSAFSLAKRNSFIRKSLNVRASLIGCAKIALAAIEQQTDPDDDVILVGSSWGGLVALSLITDHGFKPYKVVLIAPALSIHGIAARFFPDFMPSCLPSETSILLIHGTADETVNFKSSQELAAKFPQQITFDVVENGDHRLNDYLINPSKGYPEGRLLEILKRTCQAEQAPQSVRMSVSSTGLTLSDFKNFHGMLISPSLAKLCIDQFSGGKVLFMPLSTPPSRYVDYLFKGSDITLFSYYLMTMYSFTMLSTLLRCTEFLAAEESLTGGGLDLKKAGDLPQDVLPFLGKNVAVVRYFSYNFKTPKLRVKMWHVVDRNTGVVNLVEIFDLGIISPVTAGLGVVMAIIFIFFKATW